MTTWIKQIVDRRVETGPWKQARGNSSLSISTILKKHIDALSILGHGSPKVMLFTLDFNEYLFNEQHGTPAVANIKSIIELNCILDDFRRKSISFVHI